MRVWWRFHKVEAGDTVDSLARKYHTNTDAIVAANNLGGQEPRPDSKLIIPLAPGRMAEASATRFSKRARIYKTRRGDTVLSVADRFGVPEARLRSWNRIHGDTLPVGHAIKIYMPVKGQAADVINTQAASKRPHGRASRKGKGKGKSKTGHRRHFNRD